MKQRFVTCLLICLCWTAFADEPATIDMGGPRKATATITEVESDYKIKVSLIAVRCFDAGMNRRLSQEKAHLYAREALLRHLGGKKRQSATLKNVEVVEAGVVENRFVLTIRVPRQGVRLAEAVETKLGTKQSEGTTRRSLLKAKDDYLETLEVVAKTLSDEMPMFVDDLDKFYDAVGNAEELGVTRLKALGKEIKATRWLLSVERDELLQIVAVEEQLFLDRLRERVEEAEKTAKEND